MMLNYLALLVSIIYVIIIIILIIKKKRKNIYSFLGLILAFIINKISDGWIYFVAPSLIYIIIIVDLFYGNKIK